MPVESNIPIVTSNALVSWSTPVRFATTINAGLSPVSVLGLGGNPVTVDRLLLANQTTKTQNGIYVAGVTGSAEIIGANFSDPGGTVSLSLNTAKTYYWIKGGNATSLTNGTNVLTASGWFKPSQNSGTTVIAGTPGGAVSDVVQEVALTRATDADATGEFVANKQVAVTAGTYAGRTFRYGGPSSPTIGTTELPFVVAVESMTP